MSKIHKSNPDDNLLGSGLLLFAPGAEATTDAGVAAAVEAAGGYRHYRSIEAFDLTPEVETLPVEHTEGAHRKVAFNIPGKVGLVYGINADELNELVTRHVVSGGAPTKTIQSLMAAVSGNTFGFTANPAVIGNWYQILVGGVPVRNLTAVTIATLTEDVDFEVDLENGWISFLTAQAADLVPLVTGPAITAGAAGSFDKFTPLSEGIVRGIACLIIYHSKTNKVVLRHERFMTEIRPNGSKTINRQQSPIPLLATVLSTLPGVFERG